MSTDAHPSSVVVLVHGLYMHGFWMGLLGRRLERRGHRVVTFSYPSLKESPEANADSLQRWLETLDSERVDFVAHSLGGLVLRHLLHRHSEQRPGRVVTLGTPHQASAAARVIESRGLGVALGRSRAGGLLGGFPAWNPEAEIGSIAGSVGLGLGRLIPGLPVPNDGTVAVAETQFRGMTDHLVLPVTHSGLIFSGRVANSCDMFLCAGRFGADVPPIDVAARVARPRPNP